MPPPAPGLLRFPESVADGDWQNAGPPRTGLLATVITTGAAEIPARRIRRRPELGAIPTLDGSRAFPTLLGESAIQIPIHFWGPWCTIRPDSIIPHYHALAVSNGSATQLPESWA